MKYTVRQINEISNGVQLEIPDSTFKAINELCAQLGTPLIASKLFTKVEVKKKPRGKQVEANEEEWERDKFQATKMEVKTGIDADINELRLFLNKLTNKTYLDLKDKINEKVNDICVKAEDDTCHRRVFEVLYDICSTNRFYSAIFADLFVDLCSHFDWIHQMFQEILSSLLQQYDDIQYVDPNVNYDGFCEMNKVNERRRSATAFYVHLTTNRFLDESYLTQLLNSLLKKVLEMIHIAGKKNEVDELSEIIFILVHERDVDESVKTTIESFALSKSKDFASLSNKAIFKFMDLADEWKE